MLVRSSRTIDVNGGRPSAVLRVGLLGYGCVGSSVDRLLREQALAIEQASGTRIEVACALVRDLRKERPHSVPAELLTTDFRRIVSDPGIDLAVEVMGGLAPTKDYVRQLLEAGKPVVSANKQLLARHLHELVSLAELNSVPIRFEAAVGGAIPVVRTLCEVLPPGSVRRVAGVVNGTANYVLTRVEQGATFAGALEEARRLGYAEADASEDLTGLDAAAKIAILATLAFGRHVSVDDVVCEGIDGLTEEDVTAVHAEGKRLRLVGEAALDDCAVNARVAPVTLPGNDSLACVPGAFNEIIVEGDGFRSLTMRGPGAGGPETATAVLGDILAIARPHYTPPRPRVASSAQSRDADARLHTAPRGCTREPMRGK